MTMEGFTEEFAERGLQRITYATLALTLAGAVVAWPVAGKAAALSFLLGAVLAIVNFEWLQFSARKIVSGFLQERPKKRIWPKLFGRYLFLAAVAYVIFKGYFLNIPVFIMGLFLPIAAMMGEAVYEAFVAFRHSE